MKKVLSMLLAALMILSCVSVSAFAAEDPFFADDLFASPDASGNVETGKIDRSKKVIMHFDMNGGTAKFDQYVYEDGHMVFTAKDKVPETYYIVPVDSYAKKLESGSLVSLPSVTPEKGYTFTGWECTTQDFEGKYSAGTDSYKIPKDAHGIVLSFVARYEPAEQETDTFAKVFDVLVKVFGTIIGFLVYGDAETGKAVMKNLFAGIMD